MYVETAMLTILLHNFFIQRVRDNSLRPDRTPKWLKRAGLVSNNQGGTGDRKWADRYINASQPVQYDDEGRPHYLYDDDDDEDAVEMSDPHALVEPDQYINSGSTRQRRALRNKASTMTMSANERIDQPYQPYEPPRSQPKNKSLKTRTMRLLGLRSSSSSRSQSNAYEDMHRRDKFVYEGDEYASDSQPSSSRMQATGDSADLDDLDRELMGLSTRTNYPPVRTNRRSAPKSVPSTLPTSNDMSEPTRDILEYEHTF